ncbi:HdeD family acid-resistance protein [Silvimonas terrae]|uniref:HdeD family acid-resistance protein n=1 Tax=Silvimonas terrae TaxID=300266 RepID=UPI0027E48DC2|nr:HdeD family acid-resistance protein [Silvimonas terrae]
MPVVLFPFEIANAALKTILWKGYSMTQWHQAKRSWWLFVVFGVISVLFGLSTLSWPLESGIDLAWAFGFVAMAEGIAGMFALYDNEAHACNGWLLIYSVISMLFGIIAITQPEATAGILFICLSVWLLAAGIYRLAFALAVRKDINGKWLVILSGILCIALAILMLTSSTASLLTVTPWIGGATIAYGLIQITAGHCLHRWRL